ncbi:MAG: response regulator, partial [Anaerolineae bacterium]|nr:response regulator [Anaerolineae bacterium]
MNAPQPHILVVDDDVVSRKLLKRIFQRVCTIDVAENGRQALEKMVAYEYDVVLLDIMMRDLSGLDVLKILRHSKSMLELPVILISAMSDTEDVARGIRLGANDYITKPYEIDVVQARVNTQLHLKKALNDRQQLIAQLESANKMKTQLLEIASHDIKGPLNNLRMLETVMQSQAAENPSLEKFVSIMETNIQAMLRVADSVMEVRTVDKANTPLERRPLHVPDVIRRVVFQHKSAIQKKNLRVLLGDGDRWVLGDAERFQQALSNVIHNAVRYSPADATVTIQMQIKEKTCRICVMDQGVGIVEDERKH